MRRLLRSFFLVDLIKGLWLTLVYTPQPAFTFQYPKERRPVAPRYRGVLRLQLDQVRHVVRRRRHERPEGGDDRQRQERVLGARRQARR